MRCATCSKSPHYQILRENKWKKNPSSLSVSSPSSKNHNIFLFPQIVLFEWKFFFSIFLSCNLYVTFLQKCSLFAWILIIHEKKKITLFTQFYLLFFSFSFSSVRSFVRATQKNATTHCTHGPVCEETYSPKSYRYHPGLWSGKKWSCCKTVNRTAFGCQAATHWAETNNNPSPSKLSFLPFTSSNSIHLRQKKGTKMEISVIWWKKNLNDENRMELSPWKRTNDSWKAMKIERPIHIQKKR